MNIRQTNFIKLQRISPLLWFFQLIIENVLDYENLVIIPTSSSFVKMCSLMRFNKFLFIIDLTQNKIFRMFHVAIVLKNNTR